MPPYIDLKRRFLDLTVEDFQQESELVALLDDSKLLAALRSTDMDRSDGWADLLRHRRVVLFGSGGIGKTEEMKQQVDRLNATDRYAFYLRLESLQSDAPERLLPPDMGRKLNSWKSDSDQDAWFFLDSVDELKLRNGSLDQALAHLSNSIGDHVARVSVVVSSRPTDWRMDNDMATLLSWLPMPTSDMQRRSLDDAFIDVLRREMHQAADNDCDDQSDDPSPTLKTVAMLPLTEGQIRLYAEASSASAADFLSELEQRDAWEFARRPLDLDQLLAMWSRHRRLGTRREQVREHVRSMLRDRPDRPDDHLLSDADAERGAADLALALELTRTEAIVAPEDAPNAGLSDGALRASDILDTWTDAQRKTLLRSPLFEMTAYGRVGFHHRIAREYLAATRLQDMRGAGMSNRALQRLLFKRSHGVDIVLPSTRQVAAWQAPDDNSVAAQLLAREPETLVLLGDPESLPIATRQQTVTSLVEQYAEGSWRGVFLHVDHSQIKRFADPALGPTILHSWHAAGEEILDFLLQLVALAPAADCSALSEQLANDPTRPGELRADAIRALLACDCQSSVRRLAGRILADPEFFADVPTDLLPILFPSIIDADQLLALLFRIVDSDNGSWAVSRICDTIDPVSEAALALRDGIANKIVDHHVPTQPHEPLQSDWGHFAPALAALCHRQLSDDSNPASELLRASTIASRFGRDTAGGEAAHHLTNHFKACSAAREEAFWHELAFVDRHLRPSDSWDRYYHTYHVGLTGFPEQSDKPWLLRALADPHEPLRRPVALHALLDLWRQDPTTIRLDSLRAAVADDAQLLAVLTKRTTPSEPSPKIQELEARHRRTQQQHARDEEIRLEQWREWHKNLRGDPTAGFSPEQLERTCHNLYQWLAASGRRTNRRNVWDRQALETAFGPEIAELAASAFRERWRSEAPLLWSARSPDSRNTLHYRTAIGLAGVYAESETPHWTANLTTREAEVATAYATVEINSFPSYVTDLSHSHPDVVASVLGQEALAELNLTPYEDHLPTLSLIAHAGESVKQVVSPQLLPELLAWSSRPSESTSSRPLRHLIDLLSIARHTSEHDARNSLSRACAHAFGTAPSLANPHAIAWLQTLFTLDPEKAANLLISRLDTRPPPPDSLVELALASLFGGMGPTPLRIEDPGARARTLDQLFRLCVKAVRFADDVLHDGVFTPGTRDDAESARGFLLSQLIETPGPVAHQALLSIADQSLVRLPDRLRLQARARAANDADPPRSTDDVRQFFTRHEMAPSDADSLFQMLVDRLDDIADFLANDDLSPSLVVRQIDSESQMHRILARELRDRANGAYVVSLEEEVIHRKRPDIRVASTASPHKAAIEVKLANTPRSLNDLEYALRNQLVGQYLRDPNCRAGCLILTLAKPRRWRHPRANTLLDFRQAIDYLNGIAAAMERDLSHSCRLTVVGIDLTA